MHLVNGTGNSPSPGRPTPGVVKQDKSSGGSVDTTKTCSDPHIVRMSSGQRRRQRQTTEYRGLVPNPPPPSPVLQGLVVCRIPKTNNCRSCESSLRPVLQGPGPCSGFPFFALSPAQGWSARRAAPPPPQLVVEDTEDRRPPSLSPGSSASPSPCSSALDSPSAQSGASRRRSSSGSLPRRPSTLSPLCDADDGRPSWSPGSSVGPSPAGSALNPPAAEGVASRRGSGSRPSPRRPSTLSPAKGQCGFPLTALEAGVC